MKSMLEADYPKRNSRIVFIGDSITDSGRFDDAEGLGRGYVRHLHNHYAIDYPDRGIAIMNKGIGGNRVTDLAARWDEDVLAQAPTLVSISIGINDVWRQLDCPNIEQVMPELFEQVYDEILVRTREGSTADIVLMEPTVIQEDPNAPGNKLLTVYVDIVRRLAAKHGTILVPLHGAFLEFIARGTGKPLTCDGVHMSPLGDMFILRQWLKAVHGDR
ncbi:SGNH/GDSL hydrolase family protein [Paenibacillus sp. GCM10023252]|uniref:SGNH/GDSL hydrolase family protein n=1 Tax=Paenibacillus sp. GCM10023252 TaxID=3252649 RepID=UPI0036073CEF